MPASALSKALKNTHSLIKYLSSSFYFPRLPSMWTHSRTGMEARAIVSKSSMRMFHLTFSIKFRFLPLKKKSQKSISPLGGWDTGIYGHVSLKGLVMVRRPNGFRHSHASPTTCLILGTQVKEDGENRFYQVVL